MTSKTPRRITAEHDNTILDLLARTEELLNRQGCKSTIDNARFNSLTQDVQQLRVRIDGLISRVEALEADGPAVLGKEPASVAPRPTPASSLVQRRLLRCPTPATIAECGGPCEQGFHLCDCGLLDRLNPELRGPAPASSLVEQVAKAINRVSPFSPWGHENQARAAICEVATWLEARGSAHWLSVAVLRQQADQ